MEAFEHGVFKILLIGRFFFTVFDDNKIVSFRSLTTLISMNIRTPLLFHTFVLDLLDLCQLFLVRINFGLKYVGENFVFASERSVFKNICLARTVAVQGEFSAIEVRRRCDRFVPIHLEVDHVNLSLLQVV